MTGTREKRTITWDQMTDENKPLYGIKVVSLSQNLPGPIAARRLKDMGASVTKIEPPGGDPFARMCPLWYKNLNEGHKILHLDLKTEAGSRELDHHLQDCDIFLTSIRPSSLIRLSLGWDEVHSRYPRLCQVALVGYPCPDSNRSGHDITYLAALGLLSPPQVPPTLLADLASVDRAVSQILALLYTRERRGIPGYAEVSISECAEIFADPIRYGLTAPGGLLGGGSARYNLYETQDGWIAVAALEEHFWDSLLKNLGSIPHDTEYEDLRKVFLMKTSREWETWASLFDIPITALCQRIP